jgi:hypothetical protein
LEGSNLKGGEKITKGICVWCGKTPCVCGENGRSPKPEPENVPKEEKEKE